MHKQTNSSKLIQAPFLVIICTSQTISTLRNELNEVSHLWIDMRLISEKPTEEMGMSSINTSKGSLQIDWQFWYNYVHWRIDRITTINQWHHSRIIMKYNTLRSPWLDRVIITSPYVQHEHVALEHLISTGIRSQQYPDSVDKAWTTHTTKLSRTLAIQIAIRL